MNIMARRSSVEWDFLPAEATLFAGAYTFEFGNVAYAALLKRAIQQARSPRKLLSTHLIEGEVPVTLHDDLVHNVIGELEEAGIYENPGQFKKGNKLLFLVDDCKNLLIEQANVEPVVIE